MKLLNGLSICWPIELRIHSLGFELRLCQLLCRECIEDFDEVLRGREFSWIADLVDFAEPFEDALEFLGLFDVATDDLSVCSGFFVLLFFGMNVLDFHLSP